jgi:hypothetical protein
MQRRKFLLFGSLLGVGSALHAIPPSRFEQEFQKIAALITAVQEHFFPEEGTLPSAKQMNTTHFLFETISHPTYDRDTRAFVITGAKHLDKQEKGKFITLSPAEKEQALRAYETDNEGKKWLSCIMMLTLEGLLGDPIYGSNINEAGWHALHTQGGNPRPQCRYII